MSNQEQEAFEYMYVSMFNDWSAEELERFVDSVNRIYNTFCILEMISNKEIHEKVITNVVKYIDTYRSMESIEEWKELTNSMEDESRAIAGDQRKSVKMMFMNEILKTLERYINSSAKLSIKSIKHSSPGGTEFKAPKPISKSTTKTLESGPLAKTQKLIRDSFLRPTPNPMVDELYKEWEMTREHILREFMLENKTIDPEIMGLIRQILAKDTLENLRQLSISGKISAPKMVSKGKK